MLISLSLLITATGFAKAAKDWSAQKACHPHAGRLLSAHDHKQEGGEKTATTKKPKAKKAETKKNDDEVDED